MSQSIKAFLGRVVVEDKHYSLINFLKEYGLGSLVLINGEIYFPVLGDVSNIEDYDYYNLVSLKTEYGEVFHRYQPVNKVTIEYDTIDI